MANLVCFGEFMTDGEEQAAHVLAERLPEDWYVICNKTFVRNKRSWEIDDIIVGHRHVFVVDVKSIRGIIAGDEETWVLPNGESTPSPLSKVDQLARMVAGYLKEGLPRREGVAGHFVTGLILLTEDTDLRIVDQRRNAQVIRLSEGVNAFVEYDRSHSSPIKPSDREYILERLRALKDGERIPRKINAYTVIERLEDGPHYFSVLAEHKLGGPDSTRRLKVYKLSDWTRKRDHAQQKKLILRDWESLTKLQGVQCVAHTDTPFYWNEEQFLVVPYLIPPGKNVRALQVKGTQLPPAQVVKIAIAILQRLKEIHTAGVLHRNLSPNCIYVTNETSDNPDVSFADFDFARVPESETIAPVAAELLDAGNPYVAPECKVGLEFATAASDVYSVGVILYELLSGTRAADYLQEDGSLVLPDFPTHDSLLPDGFVENAALAISDMTHPAVERRAGGTEEALKWLEQALSALGEDDSSVDAPPPPGVGELIDKRYEVKRILGSGATATSLLVDDTFTGGLYVLKRIHRPEWADNLARAEFAALDHMDPHPGLMRVYEACPAEKSYQLKSEYVEGDTLDELRAEFPWSVERAVDFARRLLDAIGHLERQGVYHRDISLRNIIMGKSGPKLIDFGLARQAMEAGNSMVGTLLFRAPEVDRNEGWHKTSDLYGAAVILYWVFTGIAPFRTDAFPIEKGEIVQPGPETEDRLGQKWFEVFRKALSPDPSGRFQSAQEFFDAIARAVAEARDQLAFEGDRCINDWVESVQSVYRNCRHGNLENRGIDSEFAEETYVPTRLDSDLLPAIVKDRRFIGVFLTGNPGDGKTAFLEQVRGGLEDRGARKQYYNPNGWSYELKGHTYSANYDASESHSGTSANDLLRALFKPLGGPSRPPDGFSHTILVAINDGRLRDFFYFNQDFQWLGKQLHRILEHTEEEHDTRLLVIDLKERSLVDADFGEPSADCLFEKLLLSFLNDKKWKPCSKCRARAVCPIKFNVDTLGDSTSGGVVRARLKSLFQAVHARRRKHITIRDFRSALSYILVGIETCEEIHVALDRGEAPLEWAHSLFWNAAFNPANEPDDLLEEIAILDPALVSSPRLERFFHYHRLPHEFSDIEGIMLKLERRSPHPVRRISYDSFGRDWYPQMKRRFFFEVVDTEEALQSTNLGGWNEVYPYRHLDRYLNVLRGEEDLTEVLRDLCEGISHSDGIVDPAVHGGYLCVRTNHSDREELTVFKRFPLDHFNSRLLTGTSGEWVETLPLTLRLEWAAGGDPYLDVGLDLFEFLMRLREGYRPDAPEQQPLVIDLALFKARLLSLETTELVLMEAGRRLHRVTQIEGSVKREDLSSILSEGGENAQITA